ncbi:hypothetical protein RHSP_06462 [Rhizobium freirei PRF 81]|uniref:Uncharacterized protein n=1 Tax=Rhizobium freirei PRF 81 TaxID=363754 RepID=N6V3H1_9HYPH|nr:hypothetical protein RHSP_06462 [Rhizobium freirei PRF 81]
MRLAGEPHGKIGFRPLERIVIEQLSQKRHGNRPRSEIETAIIILVAEWLMDSEFDIELLQTVLYAADREVTPLRDSAVGQSECNVDQDFIFGLSEAVDVAETFLLHAPHFAVDHALAFDKDAAECQFQSVVGGRFQNIAVNGTARHDARDTANIGLIRIVRPEKDARLRSFLPYRAGCFDAVTLAHLQVHDDMSGFQIPCQPFAGIAVFGFQYAGAFGKCSADRFVEVRAMKWIVLDDQNLHAAAPPADCTLEGKLTLTIVPPDAAAVLIAKRAEISRARVFMFSMPPPDDLRAFLSPSPSSMTSMASVPSQAFSWTSMQLAWACRIALLMASWAIRKRAIDTDCSRLSMAPLVSSLRVQVKVAPLS